jgi:DNA-binding transcriptional LysR family regulator
MRLEARLRAFAAFARRHSFSGAAQDLRISQPAVSKHIADVERQLGVPRGGALTEAGVFLADYVLRAEAILAQAALGVPEFRTPGSGLLTIVAAGVRGTYLLPEVIAQFQKAHPGIRVPWNSGPRQGQWKRSARIVPSSVWSVGLLRHRRSTPNHCWRTRSWSLDRACLPDGG